MDFQIISWIKRKLFNFKNFSFAEKGKNKTVDKKTVVKIVQQTLSHSFVLMQISDTFFAYVAPWQRKNKNANLRESEEATRTLCQRVMQISEIAKPHFKIFCPFFCFSFR